MSHQFEEEWRAYNDALSDCGIANAGVEWLDLRGNHDLFDVPSDVSEENYFKDFGVQGRKHNPRCVPSFLFVLVNTKKNAKSFGVVRMQITMVIKYLLILQ